MKELTKGRFFEKDFIIYLYLSKGWKGKLQSTKIVACNDKFLNNWHFVKQLDSAYILIMVFELQGSMNEADYYISIISW